MAVDHEPVDLPEHVADLVQVVLRRQPRSWEQPAVVGAALAVDEHELDGGGGGELAEEVGDEHGLAEPGQPCHDGPGDLGQPDQDKAAVFGPPQPPGGQAGGLDAGQVDPGRGQQRVAAQAAQPDLPWPLLLGPDGDTAPGISQIRSGPLVVRQAGASDGGHRGRDALFVGDELGRREAMLTGPPVLVAQPQGLSEKGHSAANRRACRVRSRTSPCRGCRRSLR
ncbi:MAG TPA: hypothetical protein VJ140_06765, partial [Actinomycetota bacterium]|nr:hypothetical protein [Actinomycetota bacterium]